MSDKNYGKSMVPLPSASTSLIMSWSSASVGFCPSDLMTVPSSCITRDLNFGGDGAITVFVEESESLLELSDLFFVELVSHLSFEINKYITTHSKHTRGVFYLKKITILSDESLVVLLPHLQVIRSRIKNTHLHFRVTAYYIPKLFPVLLLVFLQLLQLPFHL